MKSTLYTLLMAVACLSAFGQSSYDFIHNSRAQVTYYGIDFTHLQLRGTISNFGNAGEKTEAQIRDVYFPGWNQVVVNEPSKYDFEDVFQKDLVTRNIRMITALNAEAPVDQFFPEHYTFYSENDIQAFVKDYELSSHEGYGIVFIPELFDKENETAWIHVVVFRESDRRVLIHQRAESSPGGFGLRSYWVRTVYNLMNDIEDDYFDEWERQAVDLH